MRAPGLEARGTGDRWHPKPAFGGLVREPSEHSAKEPANGGLCVSASSGAPGFQPGGPVERLRDVTNGQASSRGARSSSDSKNQGHPLVELQRRLHPFERALVALHLRLRAAGLHEEEPLARDEDPQHVEVRLVALVVPEAQLVPRRAVA